MTQAVVNGLLLGAGYALLALGYTLVFGVLRLLTLAHGEVFMAAGVLALLLSQGGTPLLACGLLAVVIGAALSVLTNELCFRPIAHRHGISAAVATIGFGFVVQNAILQYRGSSTSVAVPFSVPVTDFEVGSTLISAVQVVGLLVAVLLGTATHLFLRRTSWGVAMRALAHSPEDVVLLGIPARRITTLTMALAGALAGVGAFLMGLRNGSLSPLSGLEIGLTGLAVMTIGGLGNVLGALIAGLALGVVQSLASYGGFDGWQAAVPWILLLAVLLVRPTGFGPRQGLVTG
jgi:branched-chain amino acid transport system permease protein